MLTAIVISALLGATEFELAVRLWKVSRTECLIFFGAFFGVLLLGTINGVLIGIMLSFTEMLSVRQNRRGVFLHTDRTQSFPGLEREQFHPCRGACGHLPVQQ